MIVCVCHRVSDRDIGRAVHEGCPDFESLQSELLVGTACGACIECASETFEARAAECRTACRPAAHGVSVVHRVELAVHR
jgi:bacterioferritin-associated ferredoxin